jgi:hypothetical protein
MAGNVRLMLSLDRRPVWSIGLLTHSKMPALVALGLLAISLGACGYVPAELAAPTRIIRAPRSTRSRMDTAMTLACCRAKT